MDDAQMQALLDRQRDLESTSRTWGQQRFRKSLAEAEERGEGATVGAARKLLQSGIEPVTLGITEMIAASKVTRGNKHCAVKWCERVTPEKAAYMTLKVVLDGLAQKTVYREAALEIAQLILDELRYVRFQTEAPGLFEYKMAKFRTTHYTHRAHSLNQALRYADVDVSDLDMPIQQRMLVGAKLIEILVDRTGLVEVVSQRKISGRRKQASYAQDLFLAPTEETVEWMTQRNGVLELLFPIALPMVVPPLQWSPEARGGYRFALLGKYPLVRRLTKDHAATVKAANIPIVYNAVNAIQNTPWRVNNSVLALVEQIQKLGVSLAGLPAAEDCELPPKPADMETNEDARRRWKRAASEVKGKQQLNRMRRIEVSQVLRTVAAVKDVEAFYFPFNLDFRGRVYPIANYLSPQGDDLSRSLLLFADSKPVGPDGAVWIAIHGANCLGDTPQGQKVSRMTMQERVDWVLANTKEIERVAHDPLADTWWMVADKPLQFYAFAVEWANWRQAHAAGRGEDYHCSLPIAQDGSCNGLQHFSAMLRDSIGGRAVNLVPGDYPEDVYQRIADSVLDDLQGLATIDDLAALWLSSGLVTRKLCKRPTMTFGYGSKRFGFRGQIIEYLMGLNNYSEIKKHFTIEGKPEVGAAAGMMSELIWGALRSSVVAAFAGMAWMQQAVRFVVATGKPVCWTVPGTGFPVRQEYFKSRMKQVKTVLAGRVVQPCVYEALPEIEVYKQANAIAPNFVHSLDAAALMLTVDQAHEEGITCFSMIHDSYATLPADTTLLARTTRESFVRLYTEHDVIGGLRQQFIEQAGKGEDFPKPPKPGDLDVNAVLVSEYFFA